MPENTLSESRRIALFEKSNFLSGKFNDENACKKKKYIKLLLFNVIIF